MPEPAGDSPLACACDPEFDPPSPSAPAGGDEGGGAGQDAPSLTFADVAKLFVDRRDVKFWQNEGSRHNYLYWIRAMLSVEAEPPPRIPRAVALPQSEADPFRFAQARREAYGFLARAFEYPTDSFLADITTRARLEAIAAAFRQLAGDDDVSEGLALWQRAAASGKPFIGEYGLSPLRAAYTRLFYDTDLPFVPPYESVYRSERHVMGKAAGAVVDDYRQAGLGIEGNEMPDHIALECEFVSLLAGREAAAWGSGRREEAQQSRDAASRFLKSHLLSWGGKFCADLLALAGEDFYRAVARLGAGLFNDELIRLETTR